MRIDVGLVLGVFLEYILMIYYANTTLYPKKNYYLSSLIALAGYILIFLVAILGYPIINNIVFILINFVIFLLGYSISYNNAAFKSVILMLLSFLGEIAMSFFLEININHNKILHISFENSMLITLAGKIIYFIGIIIIRHMERDKRNSGENSFMVLVSVPIITFASLCVILDTDIDKRIFTVICMMSIAINILTFAINEFIMSKNHRIRVLEMENSKNNFSLEEYKLLNEKYEENRILRHDLKEHIKVAISLIGENDLQAIKYLKKMEEMNNKAEFIKYTDNSILNMLLIQKSKECSNKGIKICIKSSNPKFDFIEEMDIVAIFSNLINNAIEACIVSERKEIFLDLYTGNEVFTVVKIENSSDKEPVVSKGVLKTNKRDINSHGLGVKSIMSAIKKYGGNMSWSYDKNNKNFCTIILINTKTVQKTTI